MSAASNPRRHLHGIGLWSAVALSVLAPSGSVFAQNPGANQAAPAAATSAAEATQSADIDNLRSRAAEYWAARTTGDSTKEWSLLEPRGRNRMTPREYTSGRTVKYLAYQVEDASVDGYFGTVKVRVLFQPFLPSAPRQVNPAAVVVEDQWVRIKGTWYHSADQGDDNKDGKK